jgi:hypothetical protein
VGWCGSLKVMSGLRRPASRSGTVSQRCIATRNLPLLCAMFCTTTTTARFNLSVVTVLSVAVSRRGRVGDVVRCPSHVLLLLPVACRAVGASQSELRFYSGVLKSISGVSRGCM